MTQSWPPGTPLCVGVTGLPVAQPTRVVVASNAATEPDRDILLGAMRTELEGRAAQASICGGPGEFGCWASDDAGARNLLVYVADPTTAPTPVTESFVADWVGRGFDAVGLVRVGANASTVLPSTLQRLNGIPWMTDVRETMQALLDMILLGNEDRRVFLSYARKDGEQVAERLYDLLDAARFEVFLDRIKLDPGIDFLERIEEEILDKAMVVIVETPAALASAWVDKEIDIAVKRRLALAAVNLGGSGTIPEIAEERRCRVNDDDAVRDFLIEQHRTQLAERREAMRQSVYVALRKAYLAPAKIHEVAGGFEVDAPGGQRFVGVAPRLADLHRIRVTHEEAGGREAYLAHPLPSPGQRRADLDWLRSHGHVWDFDEGLVQHVAPHIAR